MISRPIRINSLSLSPLHQRQLPIVSHSRPDPTTKYRKKGIMSQEGVHHPTRADRQKCWKSRDEYFACLNKADVVDPSKPEAANVCVELRKHYHDACMKSWVEYFNKRTFPLL
ncbi:cytochrome oxidase c subunit VIb-domain-containing protein [Mortierella sp. GBAus27b]|nr:cytochrome oxidase c subunit VIb-domain-containing protein [Mortierella sp. GBAus27b]